jgi:hypothetical protein
MVNLMHGLETRTSIPVAGERESRGGAGPPPSSSTRSCFTCGHGNIKFTPTEVTNMRDT